MLYQRENDNFKTLKGIFVFTMTPYKALAYCLTLSSLLCIAQAAAASQWVSIKTLPGFSDVQDQLQALVNENGHDLINNLCVVGEKNGNNFQAEVYWPEENKLILWVPNINDPKTLIHSNRYLDLLSDVRNNVGTSSYLVSRSFVKKVLSACREKGDHFVIKKRMDTDPNHG